MDEVLLLRDDPGVHGNVASWYLPLSVSGPARALRKKQQLEPGRQEPWWGESRVPLEKEAGEKCLCAAGGGV